MIVVTHRGLVGAAAIPALALGLAACSSSSDSGPESNEDDAVQLSPEQVVLASYEGLEAESYTMKMTMTANGLDLLDVTMMVDGEASQTSQDLYVSAMLEARGEDVSEDPEAELAFTDIHTEAILVDGTVYAQLSGGGFDEALEEFGEDAWFTVDLAEAGDLSAVYEQVGSLDLASQTERLLNEITNVQETGDGVYTGTLREDSELIQSLLGTTGVAGDPAGQADVDPVEVAVTVDDAGLFETMDMTFPEIEGMTVHMASEVVEVGATYDIAAPDSDNLHTVEELLEAMQ